MYYVHEIHTPRQLGASVLSDLLREEWSPAVADDAATRVVWAAKAVPGSVSMSEIVTLTAVADGDALGRFVERLRSGDLVDVGQAVGAARSAVQRRIVAPLRFTRYAPEIAELPLVAPQDQDHLYIQDFVPPRLGAQRRYEEGMEQAFMRSLEVEYSDFVMWAGFETVAGGGPIPENLMITRIEKPAAAVQLLSHGNARETMKPGAWMFEALKLRDTWTSRLVRSLPWSPTA